MVHIVLLAEDRLQTRCNFMIDGAIHGWSMRKNVKSLSVDILWLQSPLSLLSIACLTKVFHCLLEGIHGSGNSKLLMIPRRLYFNNSVMLFPLYWHLYKYESSLFELYWIIQLPLRTRVLLMRCLCALIDVNVRAGSLLKRPLSITVQVNTVAPDPAIVTLNRRRSAAMATGARWRVNIVSPKNQKNDVALESKETSKERFVWVGNRLYNIGPRQLLELNEVSFICDHIINSSSHIGMINSSVQ